MQYTLHSLRRFCGRHTGGNQDESFWAVAQEYNLEGNIGYVTLDNSTNNDTTINFIAANLENLHIHFKHIICRLRCHGHSINLVVKRFLWGDDAETFEKKFESLANLEDDDAELLLRRKRGSLGKLYNYIVWIGRNPQRRDKYAEKLQQLCPEWTASSLVHGNETRWGGNYDELVRALDQRDALDEIVFTVIRHNLHGKRDSLATALKYDELTPEDWSILTNIMRFLQPFWRWQLVLQAHRTHGAQYDVLPGMDELLLHIPP